MILFQGADDKIVPPQVSREMVRVLRDHGVPHEYVEYPGEGHGFRRAETNIDALTRETKFFAAALQIDAIENEQELE
jgi:dipeptidyl aminopeptidase/acylaminoacyl peptidase